MKATRRGMLRFGALNRGTADGDGDVVIDMANLEMVVGCRTNHVIALPTGPTHREYSSYNVIAVVDLIAP